MVPIRIGNKESGCSKVVYGIIDSGADRDVISEEVIKDLEIETKTTEMRVITVDNEIVSKRTTASFTVESLDETYCANVNDGLVARLLCNDIPPSRRKLEGYHHLKSIQFDDMEAEISIIISAAHFQASIPEEVRKTEDCSLLAYRCAWGWTLTGSCGSRSAKAATISVISVRDEPLDENLQKPFNYAPTVAMDGPDADAQATRAGEALEKQIHRSEMMPRTEVRLNARQENANTRYAKRGPKGMKDPYLDNADADAQSTRADETLGKQRHCSKTTPDPAPRTPAKETMPAPSASGPEKENMGADTSVVAIPAAQSVMDGQSGNMTATMESALDIADALGGKWSADERLEEALLMRPLSLREKDQSDKGINQWLRPIPQPAKPHIREEKMCGCSILADELLHREGDASDSRSTSEDNMKKVSIPARSNVALKDLVAITQGDMKKAEKDNVRDTGVRDYLRDAMASKSKTHSHSPLIGDDKRASSRLINANIEREAIHPQNKPPKNENAKASYGQMQKRERHAQMTKCMKEKRIIRQKKCESQVLSKIAPFPAKNTVPKGKRKKTTPSGLFARYENWLAKLTCSSIHLSHARYFSILDTEPMMSAMVNLNAQRPTINVHRSKFVVTNSILRKMMEKRIASMKIETQKKGKAKSHLHVMTVTAIEVKTDAFMHHSLVTSSGCKSAKRQLHIPYPVHFKRSSASSIPKAHTRWTENKDDMAIDNRAKFSDDMLQRQPRKRRRVISIDNTAYHVRWNAVRGKDDEMPKFARTVGARGDRSDAPPRQRQTPT